jgi:hypothetical protein
MKSTREAGERLPLKANSVAPRVVYWHHELPPLGAEIEDEHALDATSNRVPLSMTHHDQLWGECRQALTRAVEARLTQEVARQKGLFAHIVDEHVEPKINHASSEYWLEGRYTYLMYIRPKT